MKVSTMCLALILCVAGSVPVVGHGQSAPAPVPVTPAAAPAPAVTSATPAPATAPATAVKSVAASLGVVAYPAKGQSADVQKVDEGECYTWAKTNTGLDPAAAVQAAQTAPPASNGAGGTRLKSAAKGAVAGTAIGAVTGDAGQGAAIGATAGVIQGGAKARKGKAQAQQQAASQAQAEKDKQLDTFRKAFAACLEGKGYTTK
jgi:Glycine-zipper domain